MSPVRQKYNQTGRCPWKDVHCTEKSAPFDLGNEVIDLKWTNGPIHVMTT